MSEERVAVGVLDQIWDTQPSFASICKATILGEQRFAHTGRLATLSVSIDNWQPTEDLENSQYRGTCQLTEQEKSEGRLHERGGVGARYATLTFVNYAAEGEWREW